MSRSFSALQRAEIAEILMVHRSQCCDLRCFSALQRAEIAEMQIFRSAAYMNRSFSALQRAEIAEIRLKMIRYHGKSAFQCSSTSRNC